MPKSIMYEVHTPDLIQKRLTLYCASEEATILKRMLREAHKAMSAGHVVITPDGIKTFYSTYADYVDGELVFAADGERIRCTRYLVRMIGVRREETKLRTVYRSYERHFR